jgi:hypothetical protein
MAIKRWAVIIDFERNNPKTKKKEMTQRSWTFVQGETAKKALEECKKRLESNEHGNKPRIIKTTVDQIVESR